MTTKLELYARGKDVVKRFCLWNSIAVPDFAAYSRVEWRFDACAYYRPETIHICIDKCSHIGTAARAWSYPGYITDRTPYGVMAHELGHHVDRALSGIKGAYGGDFSVTMRAASGEPKLTSYCPNDWEWFAEMFRLFVTNPTLLLAIRPRTYALVLAAELRPVETRPWGAVLADAPLRTIQMAVKKAGLVV